jgi:Tol biopolymer transport system component
VISGDGNHIAFEICDPWMRPDQLPICDVYALDQRNWAWTLISEGADGEHGDADSVDPAISANGRFVVYQTTATNIVGGASAVKQLVLRDRDPDGNGVYDELGTSVNEVVTVGFNGQPADGDSATAEVSDDGRFVAFRSLAGNLAGAYAPGTWHVFRRDRQSQHTTWIDLRPDGNASLAPIDSPKIAMSADGRVVVFASDDPTLTWGYPDDNNGARDIFVYDEDAEPRIRRIDIIQPLPIAQGRTPGNGPSEWPSISADGRYVAFQSAASNADVISPGPPGSTQVYCSTG